MASILDQKLILFKRCGVDFVVNKEKFRREAFVHFSKWFGSEEANKLKSATFDAN